MLLMPNLSGHNFYWHGFSFLLKISFSSLSRQSRGWKKRSWKSFFLLLTHQAPAPGGHYFHSWCPYVLTSSLHPSIHPSVRKTKICYDPKTKYATTIHGGGWVTEFACFSFFFLLYTGWNERKNFSPFPRLKNLLFLTAFKQAVFLQLNIFGKLRWFRIFYNFSRS